MSAVTNQDVENPPPLRVVAAPRPLTTLIGREGDVDRVRAVLLKPDVHLVTLTGPGGVGKTRLALRIAELSVGEFSGGVYFVDLSSVRSADLVSAAIAAVLGVQETGGIEPLDAVCEFLADRDVLLVLDNFEHLLPAVRITREILLSSPRVTMLVTSQALLRVEGEHAFPVDPLMTPVSRTPLSPERAGEIAAVRLFVSRAAATRPDFALDDNNVVDIIEICQRLDGLPLAIELAAARVNLLSVRSIVERLDRSLPLLTGGPRDLPERRRTMRDAIAWSYGLLSEDERALMRRISVFSGGFTMDALETVLAGEEYAPAGDLNLLDLLASLVEKSLVRHGGESTAEPRFSMLEMIREFSTDQLASSGESNALRLRHALWMINLVEQASAMFIGPDESEGMAMLAAEQDNLRAAINWAIDNDEPELAARLSGPLFRYWSKTGALFEARDLLSKVVASSTAIEPATLARVHHTFGNVLLDIGDYDGAQVQHELGRQIRNQLGDNAALASSLNGLGLVAFARGDYEAGRDIHRYSLSLSRDAANQVGIGNSLTNLADVELAVSDFGLARSLHEEALSVRRNLGDQNGVAYSLYNLGAVAEAEGDLQQALVWYEQALPLFRASADLFGIGIVLTDFGKVRGLQGDMAGGAAMLGEALMLRRQIGDSRGVVECMEGIAHIAATRGLVSESVRLVGSADQQRLRLKAPRTPAELTVHEVWLSGLQKQLGDAVFQSLLGEGTFLNGTGGSELALQLVETISAAPVSGVTPPASIRARPDSGSLSPREIEVLALLSTGLTDQQIADELFIARRTVTTHVLHVYAKLGVANRAEAAAAAVRRGLT